MKRVLSCLLALFLFISPAIAHDWSSVASKLQSSTLPVLDSEGRAFCSAFVIDNQRDYVMTADHCVHVYDMDGTPIEFTIDGLGAREIFGDEFLDVSVLYVKGVNRPELLPEHGSVKVGHPLASYGYARESGLYEHFRAGTVAGVEQTVDSLSGKWLVTDQSYIGGMSGGPVVNRKGKLISMVQRSDRRLVGIGRSIKSIYEATKNYWH